jgi:imidazole glycerol-phosphate synthase subunit HisH
VRLSTPAVVGVVDYRAGNIQSIANAIEHLGASAVRVSRAEQLASATHLLLPGVGAFGHCAERLRTSGLIPALAQWTLEDKRPLLGICVGMQLLADWSEELGRQQGLGWAGGAVTKLAPPEPSARVPHVGWNSARFHEPFGEFGADDEADFYFDHSYALQAPLRARTLATCTHGQTFCAAIRSGSLVAAQFHPEKSQASGLRFLRAFLALPPR